MALPSEKQTRVDAITAALRERALGKRVIDPAEHAALGNELHELLTSDAPATRQVDERTPALIARADRLHKALHGYEWQSFDRAILAEKFTATLQSLPDGVWSPPALTGGPAKRQFAILPGPLTERLRDNSLAGEAQEAAAADLDAALSGLAPAPGAGAA